MVSANDCLDSLSGMQIIEFVAHQMTMGSHAYSPDGGINYEPESPIANPDA